MEWLFGIGGLAAGVALTALIAWARGQRRQAEAQTHQANLREQINELRDQVDSARTAARDADQQRQNADVRAASLDEQLKARQAQLDEQKRMLDEAEKKLSDTFQSVGARALQSNNQQFIELAKKTFEQLMTEAKGDVDKKQRAIDELVKPIRELLDKQNTKLHELEKQREAEKSSLSKHLEMIAEAQNKLGQETDNLVKALRRPEQRGRWGEMQLRNVVELAGMTAHCDFVEQPSVDTPNGKMRPDMVVNLPGGGKIVVDAKVALDAYLDAVQPDADRQQHLQRHVRQVETHIRGLSQKAYWEQFERTPRLVVMFMPLESALSAALEHKPDLHAEAMKQHVLIATPTLLVAVLRAVAYGWQQEDVAANARQIADTGRELYERLATFTTHLQRVGSSLEGATANYNKAIGSLETRVLPSTRKLRDLRATVAEEIDSPPPVELDVRDITADELKSLTDEAAEATDRSGGTP